MVLHLLQIQPQYTSQKTIPLLIKITNAFKQVTRPRSKYDVYPDYVSRVEFKKKIVDEMHTKQKRFRYYIPIASDKELEVYKNAFEFVFNLAEESWNE